MFELDGTVANILFQREPSLARSLHCVTRPAMKPAAPRTNMVVGLKLMLQGTAHTNASVIRRARAAAQPRPHSLSEASPDLVETKRSARSHETAHRTGGKASDDAALAILLPSLQIALKLFS
jgi:hypothetical protein